MRCAVWDWSRHGVGRHWLGRSNAGQVTGFDPEQHFDRKQVRRIERFVQSPWWRHARRRRRRSAPDRRIPARGRVRWQDRWCSGNRPQLADPGRPRATTDLLFFIPQSLTNLAGYIAMGRLRGAELCVSNACATGNHSIGEAWRVIRSGDADLVIAGARRRRC